MPPFSEETFTVNIDGEVERELEFTIKELTSTFPRKTVVAALQVRESRPSFRTRTERIILYTQFNQCAGNRRNTMSKIKTVEGILWGDGAVANVRWGGVALRDVLQHAGVDDGGGNNTSKHVCFASYAEVCENDDWYGASIPLGKAMDPDGDVLLAFEVCLSLFSSS